MSSPVGNAPRVVWIGSAGTGTAFGIARTLRETWGESVRIVAADIFASKLVATSALADTFVQVPPVSDPDFSEAVLSGLAETNTTLYVPILDEEILWAAEARDAGHLPVGVTTTAPPVVSARTCIDKLLAARWLTSASLPTPETKPLADASWEGEALVAKPRCGRGSLGVELLDSAAELAAAQASGADLIVQPRCRGPELTIDVCAHANGTRAVARERLEVKAGVCTKARVFEDPAHAALAHKLATGLELRGAFCFQLMQDPSGAGPVITDINARPGAGTRLTVAAGVEILAAALADQWGLPVAPFLRTLDGERWVVRHYVEQVLV